MNTIYEFLYYNSIAFFVGFILDFFFGEPPEKLHPIIWIGKIINYLEPRFYKLPDKFSSGTFFVIFTLIVTLIPAFVVIFMLTILHNNSLVKLLYLLLACYTFLCSISIKSLKEHALRVFKALKENNHEKARECLSLMVSRDTKDMRKEKIITSTVESIAENFVDGILSPMFYFTTFGIVGVITFKVVSTFDSMIGYRNEKYELFGKFAARFDDIFNFIPARISIVFIAISSFILGYGFEKPIYNFGKYRKAHKSPNSAHPMSAFAGALKITLGGRTKYEGLWVDKPLIGNSNKEPQIEDILKAIRLMETSSFLAFMFFSLVFLKIIAQHH